MSKLTEEKLYELIKEVLVEQSGESELEAPEVDTSALAQGAGVTAGQMKKNFFAAGKAFQELGQDKKVTPNENKLVKKIMDALQLGAEEIEIDEGPAYQLLNRFFKMWGKYLQTSIQQAAAAQQAQQGSATNNEGDK